jgi:hypothetical protein
MKSKNNASTPAFPARVLTVLPSRRCSAMNRSASSHVAVHNDPVNERANSMITDRVRLTCLSQSPAAAIASAYWSTISCSKSSTSSAVRSTRGDPIVRTTAKLNVRPVHQEGASINYIDEPS